MDFFVSTVMGFFLGVIITLIVCSNVWTEAKAAHHRDAYDEHGQLTCEICKALVEKGASK